MNSSLNKYKLDILECMILSSIACTLYLTLLSGDFIYNTILIVTGCIIHIMFNAIIYFKYYTKKHIMHVLSKNKLFYRGSCLVTGLMFIIPVAILVTTIQNFIR